MAIAHAVQAHSAVEARPVGPVPKVRTWSRVLKPRSSGDSDSLSSSEACFIDPSDQIHWDSLMQMSHLGCKKSYRELLEEIDLWLDDYLLEIAFSGDREAMIIEIIQSLHDKIATYNPEIGVASWLTSISDFKIANATKRTVSIREKIGLFLALPKACYRKDAWS